MQILDEMHAERYIRNRMVAKVLFFLGLYIHIFLTSLDQVSCCDYSLISSKGKIYQIP